LNTNQCPIGFYAIAAKRELSCEGCAFRTAGDCDEMLCMPEERTDRQNVIFLPLYNAEASGRRDQAAFAEPDGCQQIQENLS